MRILNSCSSRSYWLSQSTVLFAVDSLATSRRGKKRRPMRIINAIPENIIARPMGVKSKKVNALNPSSRKASLTRMLGGVPIWVVRPPNREPYASGIRSLEGGLPVWRAMSMTTGSIKAATATLFMMADIVPALTMITTIMRVSLLPANLNTKWPMAFATPVRVKPPLRINTAQTVTTAGLLKPASASAGVTRPVKATAPSDSRAVTSIGIHSVVKKITATSRIDSTSMISGVIIFSP